MVAMIHRQYSCTSRVQLGCNPFAVVYGLSQRFGRDTDTGQTLDCGLLIGIVRTIYFGYCLLIGIARTIPFGDCPLIEIVRTIYFGVGL